MTKRTLEVGIAILCVLFFIGFILSGSADEFNKSVAISELKVALLDYGPMELPKA